MAEKNNSKKVTTKKPAAHPSGSFKLNVQAAKVQASEKTKKEKEKAKTASTAWEGQGKGCSEEGETAEGSRRKESQGSPQESEEASKENDWEEREEEEDSKEGTQEASSQAINTKEDAQEGSRKETQDCQAQEACGKEGCKVQVIKLHANFPILPKRLFSEPPHTQERTLVQMHSWDTMIMCNEEENEGKKRGWGGGVKQRKWIKRN